MTNVTQSIKNLKSDNQFKKEIGNVVIECYKLTNDSRSSILEFEVFVVDDLNGNCSSLQVTGFKQDLKGTVLRKIANDNGVQKVIFVPETGALFFKFYTRVPTRRDKANGILFTRMYKEHAKAIEKTLSSNVLSIQKLPEEDEETVNSILTCLFTQFKCQIEIKVIIQEFSFSEELDEFKVLFQNIRKPINIISILQERFGRGLYCSPQSNGILFHVSKETTPNNKRVFEQ